MKKVISLATAIILILSMAAGCSGQSAASQSASASQSAASSVSAASGSQSAEPSGVKSFKIGFPMTTVTTDPMTNAMMNDIRTAAQACGGDLVLSDWDWTTDGLVTQVQKLISMGVNGLIIVSPADTVLPNIDKMCQTAKVPYVLLSPINDTTVKSILDASPMYCGAAYEVDEQIAYDSVKKLSGLGVKNLVVTGGPQGEPFGDNRDKGINKACEETGVKLLTEPRGLKSAEDVTKAFESIVAAYPEMDGIFIAYSATQDMLPAVMKVLEGHNLAGKVKVGRIDTDSNMEEYFKKGELNFAYGVQLEIKSYIATIMLANTILGTPLSDKPMIVNVGLTFIQSSDDVQKYYKYMVNSGVPIYTADETKSLFIKYFNKDVTAESVQQLAKGFTVDDVAKRHADLVK